MNKVILMGRLTRDPEVRYSQGERSMAIARYTLAVDRNNEFVAKHYSEEHPAVMKLIERTIRKCAEAGVKCSICGQAGSVPHIVEKLVEFGISSVSSNTDAIADVRKTVARAEQKIILDAARKRLE